MRHLTIRHVSPALSRALDEERRRRGTSLNRTVLDLLTQALGLRSSGWRTNGLGRLAGTWSERDLRKFEDAVAPTQEIDEALWR